MTVIEYNQKRAIFEYLIRLDSNGCGKIYASLEVAKIVFVDGGLWKARRIRYFAKYWLINNELLISKQGKHQKTIRIIDDEDIAKRCRVWIHKQNYKITSALFKKFVEQELLSSINIIKKIITLMIAVRWLNILSYSFQ